MSYILDTFARAAFKRLIGKSHTSNTRDPANEPIASAFVISAQNVWAQKINPTPADGTNVGIVSDLITLNLEPVSGTANSGKYASYRAKLGASVPSSLTGKINRQTGVAYVANDYVGDIIPQSFGDSFRPKLYKSGVETPPLDASDWFIDTSAGVITQEEDVTGAMIDYSTGGTVQCYVYIGAFVADSLQNVSSSVPVFYDLQTIGDGITGTIDGTNDTFLLSNTPVASSVHVYLNGLLTKDFTLSGANVVFNTESIPKVGWELIVSYRTI
jgi:hypothetical protein